MDRADLLINKLNMIKHPEGGHFVEIYRSTEVIKKSFLPERYSKDHNLGTSIYYLLRSGEKSMFHRLKTDELWHFYEGCALRLNVIDNSGGLSEIILGSGINNSEVYQSVIPAGYYFSAEPAQDNSYSLIGCTMAPGFDYTDFELADKEKLIKKYPLLKEFIIKFT